MGGNWGNLLNDIFLHIDSGYKYPRLGKFIKNNLPCISWSCSYILFRFTRFINLVRTNIIFGNFFCWLFSFLFLKTQESCFCKLPQFMNTVLVPVIWLFKGRAEFICGWGRFFWLGSCRWWSLVGYIIINELCLKLITFNNCSSAFFGSRDGCLIFFRYRGWQVDRGWKRRCFCNPRQTSYVVFAITWYPGDRDRWLKHWSNN